MKTTVAPALPNGWKYTEHIIQKTTSGFYEVSLASGAMIDEVRLYPADAQMQSISYDRDTYLPQSISDVSGKLNRFEYDDLSRLLVMRNANDEFVRTHQYYHQGTGNNYNGIISRIIQTPGITTISAANALTGANVQRTIRYFDGLGRNDQSVGIDLSPTSLDLVSFHSYDTYGREHRSYLPYSVSATGTNLNDTYRTTASTEQLNFYNALYSGEGSYAFAEDLLEISPLSRSKGLKNPGQTWHNSPTAVSYQFNIASEVRNPELSSAYYAANTLFKQIHTDEDGKVITQFTDILGRKVMEDAGGLRTYFIYDGFGNIVQVIQPGGCKTLHTSPSTIKSTPSVQNQSFLYTYDNRFRLSTKKIPGTGGVYTFYYDSLDRQVLSIDPKAFKSFTKYDILSRPILTGKYTGTGTPTGAEGLYENKTTTGHFYTTNLSFPTASVQVYTVQYYDDYDFDVNYSDNVSYTLPSAQGTYYPTAAYPAVRGMETGSKSGVLKTNGAAPTVFVTGYTWYDLLGRPVHTKATHPYSGTDLSWSQYHFSGWVLRTRRQHTATLGTAHNYIINEAMTYDHAGRLLTTHHQIGDSGDNVLISSNTYNEKDELSKKKLANSQDVDYDYNIRGWLSKINEPASCTSAVLFSMGLHYNEENFNLSATELKNGNISWIEWRTGANCQVGGVTRNKGGYGFSYDGTNRLTQARYGEYNSSNAWVSANADRYTVDNLSYDENGNIKTLRRKGNTSGSSYGLIDDLAYTYNSSIPNRLNTIAETSLITKGFKKISAGATAYTYDLNGNVNKDGYRGITGTTNNYLNLPAKITYSATKYIEYTYDALGVKWKQKTVDGAAITEKYYIGGIEYNGTNLEAIYHSEGRAIPLGGPYEYQYVIKDHLGNGRVWFKMVGATATMIQESHYYPFGMEMEGAFMTPTSTSRYKYNSKELQSDFGLGLYNYGARFYDPSIGRFHAVDPLAEAYAAVSTLAYVANNPLNFTDPTGMMAEAVQRWEVDRYTGKKIVENEAEGFGEDCCPGGISPVGTHNAAKAESENSGRDLGEVLQEYNDQIQKGSEQTIKEVVLYYFGGLLFKAGKYAYSVYRGYKAVKGLSAEGAVWAQKTFSGTFSAGGKFAGQTVDDVAGMLRNGTLSAADVPINVVVRNGQTFILNTRSSAALMRAGIPRSSWNVVNQTGVSSFESMLTGQLGRNSLINGTNTIRQSGTQLILSH